METTVEPGSILHVVIKPALTSWPCQVLIPQPAQPRGAATGTQSQAPGKAPGPSPALPACPPSPGLQHKAWDPAEGTNSWHHCHRPRCPAPDRRCHILLSSLPSSHFPNIPKALITHTCFRACTSCSFGLKCPSHLPICATLTHLSKPRVSSTSSEKHFLNTSPTSPLSHHAPLPWLLAPVSPLQAQCMVLGISGPG